MYSKKLSSINGNFDSNANLRVEDIGDEPQ